MATIRQTECDYCKKIMGEETFLPIKITKYINHPGWRESVDLHFCDLNCMNEFAQHME